MTATVSTRPGVPDLHPHGLPRPGRTLVMGVVNVTPDSFSDGGRSFAPEAAVAHGLALFEQGADIVDVGGESTRPGAVRPPAEEELRRVPPVVRELAVAGGTVSVDTMRAEVAARALDAGARLVNDVSGGHADPGMLPLTARADTPYVLMHWRAHAAAGASPRNRSPTGNCWAGSGRWPHWAVPSCSERHASRSWAGCRRIR